MSSNNHPTIPATILTIAITLFLSACQTPSQPSTTIQRVNVPIPIYQPINIPPAPTSQLPIQNLTSTSSPKETAIAYALTVQQLIAHIKLTQQIINEHNENIQQNAPKD